MAKVKVEIRTGTIAVVTVGEMKLMMEEEGHDLRFVFDDCMTRGIRKFVIDLQRVEYMNSIALGILIAMTLDAQRERNGGLVLCNLEQKVKSLLVITKLTTALESFDSVDQAVAQFS